MQPEHSCVHRPSDPLSLSRGLVLRRTDVLLMADVGRATVERTHRRDAQEEDTVALPCLAGADTNASTFLEICGPTLETAAASLVTCRGSAE